jgi:hypothetical protein
MFQHWQQECSLAVKILHYYTYSPEPYKQFQQMGYPIMMLNYYCYETLLKLISYDYSYIK